MFNSWLVVSTPLKNISQLWWLFPIYGKKNVPNHQSDSYVTNYQKVAMSGHRLVITSGMQRGPPLKDLLQSDHYRKGSCRYVGWFLLVSVGLCHRYITYVTRNLSISNAWCKWLQQILYREKKRKTVVWGPMQAPSYRHSYRYSNCSWTAELSPP